MQEAVTKQMLERAKALLKDGTVTRVAGWKKGLFEYDVTPGVFTSEAQLDAEFVYNDFCCSNLSKYMIAQSRPIKANGAPNEGKIAVIIDFVGNCYAHGTPTEKRVYTLEDTDKRIRNSSREPEVTCRECSNCFRVYRGNDPICPYCGFDNKKTRKQIQMEEKAELERIEKIERTNKRKEVGMAKDEAALKQIAKERGYSMGWVYHMLQSRQAKSNNATFGRKKK